MSGKGIIALSDGDLHAEIWPENGARITAFYSMHGEERFDWLVPAPQEDIARGGGGSWGSFPLVPFSNRIRDARFTWEGREYRLAANEKNAPNAIHGHGRDRPWTVEEQSAGHAVLSFRYEPGDWPFAYSARQEFRLSDGAFEVDLLLTNESDLPMPAGLGHHPYFPWRGGPSLRSGFENYWPAVDGVLPSGPEDLPDELDFSEGKLLPRGLDTGFGGWGKKLSIAWEQEGGSLQLSGSDALGHVIVYSPPGQVFFCVEPVSHCIDAVNLDGAGVAGTGIRKLDPGETMSVKERLQPSVIKGEN